MHQLSYAEDNFKLSFFVLLLRGELRCYVMTALTPRLEFFVHITVVHCRCANPDIPGGCDGTLQLASLGV